MLKANVNVLPVAACTRIREFARKVTFDVLDKAAGKSELQISHELHTSLATSQSVEASGWYNPPPLGISVLCSAMAPYARLNFDNLRCPDYWPSDEIRFEKETVAITYVSPYDAGSKILGDFGGTFYFGSSERMKNHIARCRQVMEQIADSIRPGIAFSEIHAYAQLKFQESGLNNFRTASVSDPAGTNIGHTVPFTFAAADWEIKTGDDKNRISGSRRFLSGHENLAVPKNGAFTLESRLVDSSDSSLPNVLTHLIIALRDGKVEVCL